MYCTLCTTWTMIWKTHSIMKFGKMASCTRSTSKLTLIMLSWWARLRRRILVMLNQKNVMLKTFWIISVSKSLNKTIWMRKINWKHYRILLPKIYSHLSEKLEMLTMYVTKNQEQFHKRRFHLQKIKKIHFNCKWVIIRLSLTNKLLEEIQWMLNGIGFQKNQKF